MSAALPSEATEKQKIHPITNKVTSLAIFPWYTITHPPQAGQLRMFYECVRKEGEMSKNAFDNNRVI